MTMTTRVPTCLAASKVQGLAVKNRARESLGDIKEIMIDLVDGRVAYAVLSFGGFLGLGDKLFAIPWSALIHDKEGDHFFLDVDKQTLERAQGFNKDEWPTFADPKFHESTYAYYKAKPYWA
jgi:PRC-barrel domain